ncbi:aminotransferase class I/II-fold pyridoxal phosphate-dependent enzyme [Ekhidna sp.]
MNKQRIYLSPPNISEEERELVQDALASGWIAPIGPSLEQFEKKLEGYFGGRSVLAVNSGTSALHLALILCGVEDGDGVVVSSFTFAASANIVLYERAIPIFIDSEELSWNLDPEILASYLSKAEVLPKAIIVTHLYGMPAQIDRIIEIAEEYKVKVIEDAAESLGATLNGKYVGGFGDYGIISFNGNKIITTSAGGALICDDIGWERGRYLATQANSGTSSYEHKEAGYNYRMSNILAGIGLAQSAKLDLFIEKKRAIYKLYKEALGTYFEFLDEPANSYSNRWLTSVLVKDRSRSLSDLISYLDSNNIEARRLWKPLHLQEAYADSVFIGKGKCEELYERGICFPSGTGLTEEQQHHVIKTIQDWFLQ